MSELIAWAAALPLWLQVFLGLFAFFVVLPLLVTGIISVGPLLHAFFVACLIAGSIFGIAYLLWLLTDALAGYIAYCVGATFSLSYRKYEIARQYALISLIGIETVVFCTLVWLARRRPTGEAKTWFTSLLQKFKNALQRVD